MIFNVSSYVRGGSRVRTGYTMLLNNMAVTEVE